jgi:formylglycine-generating enzyme required for sulfatase activity
LTPPADLVPPFLPLREHLAALDALLPLPGAPGPELVAWAQQAVAKARGESALLSAAAARLTAAMLQWQRDREQSAGDAATTAALGERLTAIEGGRELLLASWPSAAALLARDLPTETLAAARQQLQAKPRLPEVDAGPALTEIRAEFERSGPTAALGERTRSLQPVRSEQLQARDALLNELQRAEAARGLAESARTQDFPAAPKPPFDDVDGYWQKLDRALQPLRGGDGALPAWAEALRGELRAEPVLQPLVVAACRAAFAQRPLRGETAAPALAAVQQAVMRARQLFPAAAEQLATVVPESALQQASTELARDALRTSLRGDADALGQRLAALGTLADWQRSAARCRSELEALEQRAGAMTGDAELGPQLLRLRGQCDRWTAVEQRLRDVDQRLGAGELTAAEALLADGAVGDEGRAERLLASELAAACRAAFVRLDAGDLDGAEAQLTIAAGKQRGLGELSAAAGARVQRWTAALAQLRAATAGMVPIAGGRTKASPQPVTAFYLSATECSRAEFARFVEQLRALVAGIDDRAQRLAKVADRFAGIGLTEGQLQELLDRDVSRNADATPIDNVTWHAAAAFAAFHGKVLPSAGEWALAAFGDGDRNEFPWGSGWSNDPEQRNPSNQQLAPVDQGGLSWRSKDGVRIHHLAGNVAEWLAADAAAPAAALAGGRYNDNSESNVREQARGVLLRVDKADARRGFGFRTALRIREFPGLEWPR